MNTLFKTYFDAKKFRKKFACISGHSMLVYKFLGEENIFCVCAKRKFLMLQLDAYKLSFLCRSHKMFFLSENLCSNIECLDIHANFCSGFS
jgi:hypothetical protein